jgi:hypothetical protein
MLKSTIFFIQLRRRPLRLALTPSLVTLAPPLPPIATNRPLIRPRRRRFLIASWLLRSPA